MLSRALDKASGSLLCGKEIVAEVVMFPIQFVLSSALYVFFGARHNFRLNVEILR